MLGGPVRWNRWATVDDDPRPAWLGDMDAHAMLAHPAPLVAPALLGWRLRTSVASGIIAEVEAYQGEDDLACHASKGRTPRTSVLYAGPGTLYVYLCYGMHHLLNLVTDQVGVPSAVLIRGLIVDGIDARRSNGPGKVARLLAVDRRHHGETLGTTLGLIPPATPPGEVCCGPRVGVDYAGPVWSAKPWRWWIAGFPVVNNPFPEPPRGAR